MKDYIEKRVLELARYILENQSTVRRTAKEFNISKSTVHTDVINSKVFIWKWRNGAIFENLTKYEIFRYHLYITDRVKNHKNLVRVDSYRVFSISTKIFKNGLILFRYGDIIIA